MTTRRLYPFLDKIGGRKIYMGIFSMLLVTIAYLVKSFQIESDDMLKQLFDSYCGAIEILFYGSAMGNIAEKFINSKIPQNPKDEINDN